MIADIDDYFARGCGRCGRFDTADCSTRRWQAGLQQLRFTCRAAGLVEAVKWGHPCYMHAGRNVAIIGALREDFRLSFFNAALMRDPAGVLERQGPNSRHPDMLRFTSSAQITEREAIIRAYLGEAMAHAEAGKKAPQDRSEPDLPEELAAALVADPELAAAFHALTPGRRRSYAINLNSAKQSETRVKRIARFRAKIIAGRGALER